MTKAQNLVQAVDLVLVRAKELVTSISPKTRRRVICTMAILLVLQMYFVRELLAAELLFAMVFAVLFSLAGICYLLGIMGERGLDLTETGVRVIAATARRGYRTIEYLTKRSLRHPHSESAR